MVYGSYSFDPRFMGYPGPVFTGYSYPTAAPVYGNPYAYRGMGMSVIGQGPAAPVHVPMPGADAPAVEKVDISKDTVGFLATIPQLLAVGIVTGAAFALGNALVQRVFLKPRKA